LIDWEKVDNRFGEESLEVYVCVCCVVDLEHRSFHTYAIDRAGWQRRCAGLLINAITLLLCLISIAKILADKVLPVSHSRKRGGA